MSDGYLEKYTQKNDILGSILLCLEWLRSPRVNSGVKESYSLDGRRTKSMTEDSPGYFLSWKASFNADPSSMVPRFEYRNHAVGARRRWLAPNGHSSRNAGAVVRPVRLK